MICPWGRAQLLAAGEIAEIAAGARASGALRRERERKSVSWELWGECVVQRGQRWTFEDAGAVVWPTVNCPTAPWEYTTSPASSLAGPQTDGDGGVIASECLAVHGGGV